MRVYMVHPGVPFSTANVYDGLVAGLRANGCEVIEDRLDQTLAFQAALYEAGQAAGVVQPGPLNLTQFVGPYTVQYAVATEPDAVIVVSAHNFNIASARALRKAGLRTAVVMTESPYFADFERTMASAYDVVFTNERRCVTGYFDHPRVHYLAHAWHPDRHTPDGPRAAPCDALFVGSAFAERADLFGGVDWSGLSFVWRGYRPGEAEQDIVDNAETAAHYRAARVSLNPHRTTMEFGSGRHIAPDGAESLNPRAYEIPACGGFMLCDDSRVELQDVFGGEAPTYRAGNSADLARQVRQWLARPDERQRRAEAMTAAVQAHSWTVRARQVLEVLA
jgi:spore maturation protein CgeB